MVGSGTVRPETYMEIVMQEPTLFMLDLGEGDQARKAVSFPVLARGNTVILATTAHSLAGCHTPLLFDGQGKEGGWAEAPMRTTILPPEHGMDLAFIEVDMKRVPRPVELSTDPIANGTILSHARNVIGRDEFRRQSWVKTSQTVSLLPRRFAAIGDRLHERADLAPQVMRRVPCHLHEVSMRSWPEVCGSPLWNQSGRVVGMVVCGGKNETRKSVSPHTLIFLPADLIRENLTRQFG